MEDVYDLLSKNDYFFVSIDGTPCININGNIVTFEGESLNPKQDKKNSGDNDDVPSGDNDDGPSDDDPSDDDPSGDGSSGNDSSGDGLSSKGPSGDGPTASSSSSSSPLKLILARVIKTIKSKDEKSSFILPLVLSLSK